MDSAWVYGIAPRSEPGLEAFSEWLSSAMRRHKGTRWGIFAGTVGGSSGVAGGATGAIAGATQGHAFWLAYAVPWALWLVLAAYMTSWLIRSLRSEANAELKGRESSRVITMVANARARGRLKAELGAACAEQLNAGAALALRCRALLDSPELHFAGDVGAWANAAERARNAMDAGMLRLITLAVNHGAESEMQETVGDMRAIADELIGFQQRHVEMMRAGTDRPDDLRGTLQHLRDLSQAEEAALDELRAGGVGH